MAKAKKTKSRFPKVIAGVRVPRELRDAGEMALKLARHPVVADVIAAGLIAAAAALKESDTVRKAAHEVGDNAGEAATEVKQKAKKLKRVVKAAAGAIGQSILDEITIATKGSGRKRSADGGARSTRPRP